MREVTREEFFKFIGPLNVHPCPEKQETRWVMQDGTRRVVGITTPGYMCQGVKTYKIEG